MARKPRTVIAPVLALFLILVLSGEAAADLVVEVPPAGTFTMRPELAGVHPRLHFTAADIPEIRSQALGPRSWFVDRAEEAFGGYLGQGVDVTEDWKHYLFGFWGQFAMAMLYLVHEDPAYADTAIDWALYYARSSDWLADDLVPMDITTGMALTYDILYDRLTEPERAELRAALFRSIDFMYDEFLIDEYWTNDFQNNHMHNRVHGMAHAALAILGDDPAYDAQPHADLALACFQGIASWLADDGSSHEGPGYFDYGHHWIVRLHALFEHVTGNDYYTDSNPMRNDAWFRFYMMTPGWTDAFNIGDGGGGEPSNYDALAWPISRGRDAHAADVLRTLLEAAPGGVYQQVAWGLLWYDGTMDARPVAEMPPWRFWPDLEMFSIRSSWDADATALVFKCGPPGGHEMRQRGSGWVNVAHDHPDQNHFMLWAFGKMMAVDDGYPRDQKLTRSHNSLTVDGAGQTREGEAWYQPFPYEESGTMDDVFLSGLSAYGAGNASLLYAGAERVVRHLMFVEGEYVVILDDLVGADAAAHTFEWRLHKDGDWSEEGPGHFAVADGDVSLDIRFLAPDASSLQSQLLPAELTAAPCLAVSTEGAAVQLLSVLVPRQSGAPVVDARTVSAAGGMALLAEHDGLVDLFAVALESASVSAEDSAADASAFFVRTESAAPAMAMAVRATGLQTAGRTILGGSAPANLSWRREGTAVLVEAEAAYGAAGGDTAVQIGWLDPGETYTVEVEGTYMEALADANGLISVNVNLAQRRTLRVTPGPPPEGIEPIEPGEPAADGAETGADVPFEDSLDVVDREGESEGGGGGCSCAVVY